MSLFNGEVTKPNLAPVVVCVVCGAHEDIAGDIWGAVLCYGCFGHWFRDKRFTCGEVERACGIPPMTITTAEQEAASDAELRRRTAQWVGERRKARAA